MADPKQTPAVPASISLRVRVVTRAGRGLSNAMVRVEAGSTAHEATTAGDGKATLKIAQADLKSPQVKVTVKKHHHAPDDGTGALPTPGEFKATIAVTSNGFDEAAAGVRKGKEGTYLEVRLIDGGFRFAAQSAQKSARRLTNDEVLHELMYRCLQGDAVLNADSDVVFEHDETSSEFEPCDPTRCKLKTPTSDRRVSLREPKLAGVTFLYTDAAFPSLPAKGEFPGQRFLRDKFHWLTTGLLLLDQRSVVALARLCEYLRSAHGMVVIYTQAVSGNDTGTSCHSYGMALDLAGVAKALPDAGDKTPHPRLGVDFIVSLHWGNVPMWDAALVASNPTDPTKWRRRPDAVDDKFNFRTADPSKYRLHYRLDPAPYQEPPPPSTEPGLATELAKVAPHFQTARTLFLDIYNFLIGQYNDQNVDVGPLPPGVVEGSTPIDSHVGYNILHADYPTPNSPKAPGQTEDTKDGRQAHWNHFHVQFGPTFHKAPRKT